MFYILQDEKIVLFDTDKEQLTNTLLFMPQYAGLPILETDRPIVDFQFADTEEYIAEQERKEKERIARLSCTKRDFALMLQEMGVNYYTQLKPLIDSNAQAQLEWELCERLYRFNPMIDLMAGQLGVTPEMLDGLFQYANGEISASEFEALIPKEEQPVEEPVEEM